MSIIVEHQPNGPTLPRAPIRFFSLLTMLLLIGAVIAYKGTTIAGFLDDPLFVGYGFAVAFYILGRLALARTFRPRRDPGYEPVVAIVMPAFQEEEHIERAVRSLLVQEYPRNKLEIVVVDDGSRDGTLERALAIAAEDARVRVIAFPQNRGKRVAMAAGIRATRAEIVAFVDSDSALRPDAVRAIVGQLADSRVGAVAGHAEISNSTGSLIARMQAARYFVAFRVMKAAEARFGAVICCSGCFSAYRRSAVEPHLEAWENQKFLGRQTTFGDDRSLTNYVLRDWRVSYEPTAVSVTAVPEKFTQFMRQQLRWKRSWSRESPILGRFVWRKHPLAALSVYMGIVLTLLAPVAATRALIWRPAVMGLGPPVLYLGGLVAMALIYGLFFASQRGFRGGLWACGVLFIFFYVTAMLWQTYWALLTCRKTTWGTKPAPEPSGAGNPRIMRPGLPLPGPATDGEGWRAA